MMSTQFLEQCGTGFLHLLLSILISYRCASDFNYPEICVENINLKGTHAWCDPEINAGGTLQISA